MTPSQVGRPSSFDNPGSSQTRVSYSLAQGLRTAASRAWVVVLAIVVCGAAAYRVSEGHSKVYRATGQVRLEVSRGVSDDLLTTPASAAHTASEMAILQGPGVGSSVAIKLGLRTPPQATFVQRDASLATITASARSARSAADIVNAYASAYVDQKRTQDAQLVTGATKYLTYIVNSLQAEISALEQQLFANATVPLSGQATARVSSELTTGEIARLRAQQQGLQGRLNQLQFDAALGKSSDAALIYPAYPPTSASSPRPRRDAALGAALGLLLGIGLALLFEIVDDRMKTRSDVEAVAPGLPVLGTLLGDGRSVGGRFGRRGQPPLVTLAEPTSAASDAYRALRTAIRFLGQERPIRAVQVTRPGPSGEHSSVLANLAISWAQADQMATAVCADLRWPKLHDLFGVSNAVGLTSVVLGDARLGDALQPVEGEPGLELLTAGPPAPNPSELLSSAHADRLFDNLINESEVLFVDSPPILSITDAAVLSQRVDATIVVVTLGLTTRRELAEAIDTLSRVKAPVVGTVILDGRPFASRRSRYPAGTTAPARRPAPRPDRPVTIDGHDGHRPERSGAEAEPSGAMAPGRSGPS